MGMRKRPHVFFFLCGMIAIGAFMRIFCFSAWMPFELDQARDVFVVYDAVHGGVDEWPLLGPQARGRALFLGPIFYYFAILFGMIFGVSPESVALPDLIFSIGAIPLFYFFARLFFGRFVSMSLTSIVATSLFLVVYGRFAWNPNSMFFWSLVTFYALLRAYRQKNIINAKWFSVFSCGFAIVTQLHFIAFIVTPLIAGVYMIARRRRIPIRVLAIAFCITTFFYAPVIVSEIQMQGQNTRMLLASVMLSPDAASETNVAADREHDLLEKFFRFTQETAVFYWNILSADDIGRKLIRTDKARQGYFPLICDIKCRSALSHHLFAGLIFLVSFGYFVYRASSVYRASRRDPDVDELWWRFFLVALWMGFGGVFLVMVAYQISPRFYIFLVAPFLIVFGVFLDTIARRGRVWRMVCAAVVGSLVAYNLFMTWQYFGVLHDASRGAIPVSWNDIPMNRSDVVTLAQLRIAGDFVAAHIDDNAEGFVVVGDNRYARALYYIVFAEQEIKNVMCYVKKGDFEPMQLRGKKYFLLVKSGEDVQTNNEILATHRIGAVRDIGTIVVYEIVPSYAYDENEMELQCHKR